MTESKLVISQLRIVVSPTSFRRTYKNMSLQKYHS